MRNNGNGTYTDITVATGIQANIQFTVMQVLFRDFDNDGFLDIIAAGASQRIFRNNGNNTFSLQSTLLNGANQMESFSVGDLNHDGKLDIYAGYAQIYNSPTTIPDVLFLNNTTGSNHYLAFDLAGTSSNKNGIGAVIKIYGSFGVQSREVRSGEGYGIQNTFTQHFGLGAATQIDSAKIIWPSGIIDKYCNLAADQFKTVTEGSTAFTAMTTSSNNLSCASPSATLTASGGSSYLWNTAATTATISATAAGSYTVSVTGANGCRKTSSVAVSSSMTASPYGNNFDVSANNWITGGTASSWEWSTSTKPIATRLNKVWITRANSNGYNNNELSYLYSPCFSLAGLANPTLLFKRSFRLATGDKAWIEYSSNGGAWTKLGTTTAGAGWYNTDFNTWEGISGLTQTTIALPVSLAIQFRIVFQTTAADSDQGFLLDNFRVYSPATVLQNIINESSREAVATSFSISPNPGQNRLSIHFQQSLADDSQVLIFNTMGILVADLSNEVDKMQETQKIEFDATNLPQGIYYIFVENEGQKMVNKWLKM